MSDGMKTYLNIWALGVAAFGLLLAGGALPATDGFLRLFFVVIQHPMPEVLDAPARFFIGLMGALTLGWGLTFRLLFKAAHALPADQAGPIWRGLMVAAAAWYVVDSGLSVATGYPFNAISNTVLVALMVVPVWQSGVLKGQTRLRP